MASNVRFIDSVKVGSYQVIGGSGGGGSGINILNNVNNYVLSATGASDTIRGNPQLIFDGTNLGIGGASAGSRLSVQSDGSNDLLLIKNTSTNQGLSINNDGIVALTEFSTLPAAIEGGIIYSSDEFYVGLG
tara:strand:- start:1498 stop:1893 length:396 start_codon:yes stop_codon:yes gene_type:complete